MSNPTFDFGVVGGLAFPPENHIFTANPNAKPLEKPKKTKRSPLSTANKTIKEPGLSNARTAQACDRCRAKKLRCDGKLPACSSCASAGLKCIVSDKLSRRAFPKGYTETLEERVRQLEAENTKLQGLVDLRDEQLAISNVPNMMAAKNGDGGKDEKAETASTEKDSPTGEAVASHIHDESCKCCSGPNAIHERPVSLAGAMFDVDDESFLLRSVLSDDEFDTNSLLGLEDNLPFMDIETLRKGLHNRVKKGQERPAPGAFAAATAIEQMQKVANIAERNLKEESKQQLLTGLVAASIPRSTEETLFVPTLLAHICQLYGYSSKPAIITAHTLASLKDNSTLSGPAEATTDSPRHEKLLKLIMDRRLGSLSRKEAMELVSLCDLPPRIELDHLVTVFFQTWGSTLPILSKQSFLKNYMQLTTFLDGSSLEGAETDMDCELLEKCGAIMVLVVSLATLSNRQAYKTSNVSECRDRLRWYHKLIQEFVKPNCVITNKGSMLSLQILTLSLQYCFAVGDVNACYELRGRVITMAQQLRLHRCPAAVLGLSKNVTDVESQHYMQGERRILFWCIYCLDVYASLNLGIPRLLKDYEIECAMPFSGKSDEDENERDNENILVINNTSLTIFGKVSRPALAFMQYCKVLGNIVDSIFSRYGDFDAQRQAVEKEAILDSWRRDLPEELKFQIDVNGFSLKTASNKTPGTMDDASWSIYSKQQLCLIFLYYHAKILIYLPIISKHGYHHNAGMSMKERLSVGQADMATVVSSTTMIQQSSIQILKLLKYMVHQSRYVLPIPTNIPRAQAKFSLLVAQGSLDYSRGGALYSDLKKLLLDVLISSQEESKMEFPGSLSKNTLKLLDYSILSILGVNVKKNPNPNDLRKRTNVKSSLAKNSRKEPIVLKSQGATDMHPGVPDIAKSQSDILEVPTQSEESGIDYLNSSAPTTISMSSSGEGIEHPELHSRVNENYMTDENLFDHLTLDQLDEGLEDIFKFDPFKMNSNDMMSDFVADGSLGLVPFLNENKTFVKEEDDNCDNFSDKMDDDGAFSFN